MTQINIGVLIDKKVKGRVAFDEEEKWRKHSINTK